MLFLYTAILCPSLDDIQFGKLTYSTDKPPPFELGTLATYNCDPTYKLSVASGASSFVRECEGNYSSSVGIWSGYEPICRGEPSTITIQANS